MDVEQIDWTVDEPIDRPCGHAEPQAASQLHGVCVFCWRDRCGALRRALKAALSSAAGAGCPACDHEADVECDCRCHASHAPEDAAKLEDATAQVEALRAIGVPAQVNPDYPFAPASPVTAVDLDCEWMDAPLGPPAAARGYEPKSADWQRKEVLGLGIYSHPGARWIVEVLADLSAAERALSSSEARAEAMREALEKLLDAVDDDTCTMAPKMANVVEARAALAAASARGKEAGRG